MGTIKEILDSSGFRIGARTIAIAGGIALAFSVYKNVRATKLTNLRIKELENKLGGSYV